MGTALQRRCKAGCGFSSFASVVVLGYGRDVSESTVAVRLRARLAELKRVTADRHRLPIATPEYLAALEHEMRLISEIRRLVDEDRDEAARARTGT